MCSCRSVLGKFVSVAYAAIKNIHLFIAKHICIKWHVMGHLEPACLSRPKANVFFSMTTLGGNAWLPPLCPHMSDPLLHPLFWLLSSFIYFLPSILGVYTAWLGTQGEPWYCIQFLHLLPRMNLAHFRCSTNTCRVNERKSEGFLKFIVHQAQCDGCDHVCWQLRELVQG